MLWIYVIKKEGMGIEMGLYEINKDADLYIINNYIIVDIYGVSNAYECSEDVISIIAELRNGIPIKRIKENFKENYSENDIDDIIEELGKIGILREKIKYTYKCISICGDRSLFDYMITEGDFGKNELNYVEKEDIGEQELMLYLHAEGDKDYYEFNKILCEKDIPFINVEFAINKYIIGPYVLPRKNACLKCCRLQRTRVYGLLFGIDGEIEKMGQIIIDDDWEQHIGGLFRDFCYKIKTIISNNEMLLFYSNKQVVYSLDIGWDGKEVLYSRKSSCDICGIHVKKLSLSTNNVFPPFTSEKRIIYKSGGSRTVSVQATRKKLEDAISYCDMNILINKVEDNPLSDILPTFEAQAVCNSNSGLMINKQMSYGKGITDEQAYFSAGFELFERLSAADYMSKQFVRCSPQVCGQYEVDVNEKINAVSKVGLTFDSYKMDKDVDYVYGYSLLSKKEKLVPASLVFWTDTIFEGNYFNNGTSGLASGACLEDAIVQALLEIIEHDAMIIGQCERERKPIVDYDNIDERLLKIIEDIRKKGYNVISRDYTNDIGIPVIVTWIWKTDNCIEFASRGWGCSVYPMVALERSLTEAVQTAPTFDNEAILNFSQKNYIDLYNNPGSVFNLSYFTDKDLNNYGNIVDITKYYPDGDIDTIEKMFNYISKKILKACGNTDILYVDLTSALFNIPVVKVIITKDIQELGEPPIITTKRLGNIDTDEIAELYSRFYCGRYPH